MESFYFAGQVRTKIFQVFQGVVFINFSYFIQTLYEQIGSISESQSKADFVVELINNVVEEHISEDKTYNPISEMQDDTLLRYYNGNRKIPDKKLQQIKNHYSQDRLRDYLEDKYSQCSLDAFSIDGIEIKNGSVDEIIKKHISDFESIIKLNSNKESFEFFVDALKEYNIDFFVEKIDPTASMNIDWITEYCEKFCDLINNKYNDPLSLEPKDKVVKNILEYAEILNQYTIYLGLNMRPLIYANSSTKSSIFVPLFREENPKWATSFNNEVMQYRKKLCNKYKKIYELAHK